MTDTPLFLRACKGHVASRPPVWMMRQAGRYLPEYRAVRAKADFLTMVKSPALAAEVTLQPVERLGVDAAIIFSDILVLPEAMGLPLTVEEGVGPRFGRTIRSIADYEALRDPLSDGQLEYVFDAIRLAKRELAGRVPLIGFAGAPWTLAAYMIEGEGTKQFSQAKRMLVQKPELAHRLLARLADAVGAFLVAQADAGAEALQLFDSWSGALGADDYRTYALPYLGRAAAVARRSGVPLIVFSPGANWALAEIARTTKADVMGIDWHMGPRTARRRLGRGRPLQGNLDPAWLYAPAPEVRRRTREMIRAFGSGPLIANLGHGILPDTPVDSARAFIDTVKELA